MNYKDWLKYRSGIEGRDVSQDEQDYNLESYYNSLKANPNEKGMHLEDEGKLPNHPTFSTQSKENVPVIKQGGEWVQDDTIPNGWKFKASPHNIENMGAENLQRYFNEVESPEALDIPNDQKVSKERFSKLKSIFGKK